MRSFLNFDLSDEEGMMIFKNEEANIAPHVLGTLDWGKWATASI